MDVFKSLSFQKSLTDRETKQGAFQFVPSHSLVFLLSRSRAPSLPLLPVTVVITSLSLFLLEFSAFLFDLSPVKVFFTTISVKVMVGQHLYSYAASSVAKCLPTFPFPLSLSLSHSLPALLVCFISAYALPLSHLLCFTHLPTPPPTPFCIFGPRSFRCIFITAYAPPLPLPISLFPFQNI